MKIVYSLNKECFKCKKHLSILEFTPNYYNKSGFDSYCRACRREYRSEERKRMNEDPIKLEQHRKWNREYYHQNKERIKFKALTK